jgi:hypothetical protein
MHQNGAAVPLLEAMRRLTVQSSLIPALVGRRVAVMSALVLFASGCTLVRGGTTPSGPDGAPAAEVAGAENAETMRSYGGSVTFDGNRISLVLELVGVDSDFSARLSIPSLDLDAGGAGKVEGEQLSVDLSYAGTCPGRLRLNGRLWEGMRRIEGSLRASDCTGEEEGAVVLLLRPGG